MDPRKLRSIAISALGIGGLFLLWHLIATSGLVDRVMLPSPGEVFGSALAIAKTGELQDHVQASVFRMALGYAAGSSLGILVGVILGRSRSMESLLGPILQMARAIPPLALVPLIIFWFGINEGAKISLIGWATFFPVWINTLLGVKGVNPLFIRAGQSLGARRGTLLLKVVIPAALAPIFSGMRVALSISFTVLVAAELAGALAGLGYLIQTSALSFRVDNIFVGIVVLAILGFIADMLFMLALYRLFPWYRSEQTGK
ncbi:NitT/TauT family transport system permease protein/sulfonate transport system permease protein [Tardiphaga robiniae]|uniref:ABC transporter permease n=1 Tax=Tardiphaga robiniae TaxID=943830 RepID=UPI002857E08B|nr:ABC transporter permease [Tardiphaga robiniae]MDR6658667.1 NitT/TauT family transport system permease protein/sulfonate transport system permease protein [Tardiphaga robiniae]